MTVLKGVRAMFVTLQGSISGFTAASSSSGGDPTGGLDFSLPDNSWAVAWF
jgi:hypothetical protein